MEQVDSVTLISSDGSTEESVGSGRVVEIRTGWVVKVPAAACPDWTATGVDVVAADGGSVTCAFTAGRVLLADLAGEKDCPSLVFRPSNNDN